IADATVSAVNCTSSGSGPNASIFAETPTDADGRFLLSFVPSVTCMLLWVKKEGYVSTSLSLSKSVDGLRVDLQRLRQVSGKVVEVDGGPVAGVRVVSSGVNGPVTFTDDTGSFVQPVVGTSLRLDKPGYVFKDVDVPPGPDAVALGTVRIQRAISVSGS